MRKSKKVKAARRNRRRSNSPHGYEQLEARQLLAISALFDAPTDTLTIEQTAADGTVMIVKDATTGNYLISDNVSSFSTTSARSLKIDVSGFGTDVTFTNNQLVDGNVTVDLGNQDKRLRYNGSGDIGGDLTVNGGANDQDVLIRPSASASIGGDVTINLTSGGDKLDVQDMTIGGRVFVYSANNTSITRSVLNSRIVFWAATGAPEPALFQFTDSTVAGDFSYLGNDLLDAVGFNTTTIDGDVFVNLKLNDSTFFLLPDSGLVTVVDSQLNGNLTVASEGFVNSDRVKIENSTVMGDISIDLGPGKNAFEVIGGNLQGAVLSYVGSTGVDTVSYGPTSTAALDASFRLGDDVDTFTLTNGSFASLFVSFADSLVLQDDLFINGFTSAPDFPVTLEYLQGFDFSFVDGNAISTQRVATPSIRVNTGNMSGQDPPTRRVLYVQPEGMTRNKLFHVSGDLSLNMLDGTGTLVNWWYQADLFGDLRINLGSGSRELKFDDEISPDVARNTYIFATDGDQLITNFRGKFGNNLTVNLGTGDDRILNHLIVEVGNRMKLVGVNDYDTTRGQQASRVVVGENLIIDNRTDDVGANVTLNDLTVVGNVSFFGGALSDRFILEAADIAGRLYANLGDGDDFAETESDQQFSAIVDVQVGGDLTVISTADETTLEAVDIGSASELVKPTIGGNLYVDLANGFNTFDAFATVDGARATYRGKGVQSKNSLRFDVAGATVKANIVLGAGRDIVDLIESIDVADLRVDFGGGELVFRNKLATTGEKLDFNTRFLNLSGFNVLSNVAADNIHFQQVSTLGNSDLVIESGAKLVFQSPASSWGQSILNSAGGVTNYQYNPTANVSIRMLDYSETSLLFAISKPLEGALRVNLGDGDRLMNIVSNGNFAVNPIGIATRIVGGEGDQAVELADSFGPSSGPYGTTYLTAIDLGDGRDTVSMYRDASIGGAFILQGVNKFLNESELSVGFNMTFDTRNEFEPTQFASVGPVAVQNLFNYFGGAAVDQVFLENGFAVGGAAYVSLGDGVSVNGDPQRLTVNESRFRSLTATAGDAAGSNRFFMNTTAVVDNGLVVNFNNNSVNYINAAGTVSAGNVIIRGGSRRDLVTFSANADNAAATIQTFDGSDSVWVTTAADVTSLWINFGNDVDEFFSEFGGAEPFDLTLVNLP